jgi:Secretion system C-terminal sorting domain
MPKNMNKLFQSTKEVKLTERIFDVNDIEDLISHSHGYNTHGHNAQVKVPKQINIGNIMYFSSIIVTISIISSFWFFGDDEKSEKQTLKITKPIAELNQEEKKEVAKAVKEGHKIIPIIKLKGKEELERIGIYDEGDKFRINRTDLVVIFRKEDEINFKKRGYDIENPNEYEMSQTLLYYKEGVKRRSVSHYSDPSLQLTKAEAEKEYRHGIAPIASMYKSKRSSALMGSGRVPTAEKDVLFRHARERDEIRKIQKESGFTYFENEYEIVSEEFEVIPMFVPVSIGWRDDDGDVHDFVLWYVATPEFVDAMPERYKDVVRDNFPVTDFLEDDSAEEYVPKITKKVELEYAESDEKAFVLELTKEELLAIGVEHLGDSLLVQSVKEVDIRREGPSDEYKKRMLEKFNISDGVNKFEYLAKELIYLNDSSGHRGVAQNRDDGVLLKEGHNEIDVPIMLFNSKYFYDGKYHAGNTIQSFKYDNKEDLVSKFMKNIHAGYEGAYNMKKVLQSKVQDGEESIALFNKFLTVKLRMGDSSNTVDGNKYADVYLIYEIEKKLIEKLPPRYRNSIAKELDLYDEYLAGEIELDEICENLEQESVLGLCEMKNGDLTGHYLSPNPSSVGYVVSRITAEEDCDINVNIYSVTGRYIDSPKINYKLKKGTHDIKINIEKIQQGIYLLITESSNGGKVSQNFIKQ